MAKKRYADFIKKHGAKPNSKAPVGQGGRFAALEEKLSHKGVRDPAALAASIGRKKFGKGKFQSLSKHGK
jgi:hypothetical protein